MKRYEPADTAKRIAMKAFNGKLNPFTTEVLEYGFTPKGNVFELSKNDVLGSELHGVSVVSTEGKRLLSLGRSFGTEEEARKYVSTI